MGNKILRRTAYTLLNIAIYLGACAYLVNIVEPAFEPSSIAQTSEMATSVDGYLLVAPLLGEYAPTKLTEQTQLKSDDCVAKPSMNMAKNWYSSEIINGS